jgi:hypothetical protein
VNGNYRAKLAKQIHRKIHWLPNGEISSIRIYRVNKEYYRSTRTITYGKLFTNLNIDRDASLDFSRQLVESIEKQYFRTLASRRLWPMCRAYCFGRSNEKSGNKGASALRADSTATMNARDAKC